MKTREIMVRFTNILAAVILLSLIVNVFILYFENSGGCSTYNSRAGCVTAPDKLSVGTDSVGGGRCLLFIYDTGRCTKTAYVGNCSKNRNEEYVYITTVKLLGCENGR